MVRGVVLEYQPHDGRFADAHERATRMEVARRLAALKGYDYGGEYDASIQYPGNVYFVPSDTIVGANEASKLRIRGAEDLFGGVVPYSFVATKAITHPLLDTDAAAPSGWIPTFPNHVRDVALFGFSAFTPLRAMEAGKIMLERGPVRIKPVRATAGHGQRVVTDLVELEAILAAMDPQEIATDGIVLEENLDTVSTFSIGQVQVADLVATYYGSQRLTRDNSQEEVYGGSDLVVLPGGFDALLGHAMPDHMRVAVEQARVYDHAAGLFFGMFASRRNYDVAQGVDARGIWRSGVLEQSWRMGGATGAEIAALEAFRNDPSLQWVRASTFEVYGKSDEPPSQATVYFHGIDERLGNLTKYTLVEGYGHT